MGKARSVRKTGRRRRGGISFRVSKKVQDAIDKMRADGRKVVVVGGVKRGKIEMDPQGLAAAAKKFPRKAMPFVALNAPFRTRALTGAL